MSAGLPGYDAWKLASPPEYERPELCPECEQPLGETGCDHCGWDGLDGDGGDAYDTLEEAELAR